MTAKLNGQMECADNGISSLCPPLAQLSVLTEVSKNLARRDALSSLQMYGVAFLGAGVSGDRRNLLIQR